MPTLADSQSVVISGVTRVYDPTVDREFQKEVQAGTARVRKYEMAAGNSLLKTAKTDTTTGIVRAQILLRDKQTINSEPTFEQVYLVATFKQDDPASRTRAIALTDGLGAKIQDPDFVSAVFFGAL